MIHHYNKRLELCHRLAAELPEASIVCGAKRCSFISIDRGETFEGSSGFENGSGNGSVWSRPPIGERGISWHREHGRDVIHVQENEQVPVHLMRKYASATRILARIEPPIESTEWLNDAVRLIVGAFREWCRPVSAESIAEQKRKGEKFTHRRHELPPLPEPRKAAR